MSKTGRRKETSKQFRESDRGKEAKKRYSESEKGKETVKRFRENRRKEKGVINQDKSNELKFFRQDPKRAETWKKYEEWKLNNPNDESKTAEDFE